MSDALSQMIEALGHEANAIRKRGDGINIELRGGERIRHSAGLWLYRFVISEALNLREDTQVEITAEQDCVSGRLVSFLEGVLIVALEKDLGLKIPLARLAANKVFLVDRLREKLQKVHRDEVQFNRLSADRVLGIAKVRTTERKPNPSVTHDGGANADQIRAICCSLGSDTTFVWGPPGTGKTTTRALIVEAHYRAGCSVLIVSNTNIAVDTLLERVAERLKGESDFHRGLVIRQGLVVKEELRRRFGPQVIVEEIIARLSASLEQEKVELTHKETSLEIEERTLDAAVRDLTQLSHACVALAREEKKRHSDKSISEKRKQEADDFFVTYSKLRADLERARTIGAVRRFFSGSNPTRIKRELMGTEQAAIAAREASRAKADDVLKRDAEIQSLRETIDLLVAKSNMHPPVPEIESRLGEVRYQRNQIFERISDIDGQIAEIGQQVIARNRILATTVHQTYLSKSASSQFDTVVIDESSMIMPPLVYYVAGLANHSVIVAGDFRQLPPIITSEGKAATECEPAPVFLDTKLS